MNIGENIKKVRESKKVSQEQLSKISGIPRTSLGRYERGERTPTIDMVNKIADALNVNINILITKDASNEYENCTHDDDIYIIQRAKSKMPKNEQDKMMKILKTAFEDYFNDED